MQPSDQIVLTAARGCASFGVSSRSNRRFARHHHDEFGVGLMIAGGQTSWSGRGLVEAGAQDVITVNPGEVHDGRPLGGRSRVWRMLFYRPETVAALFHDLRSAPAAALEFTAPVVRDGRVRGRLAAALRLEKTALDAPARLRLEEETLALFDHLLPAGPPPAAPERTVHARAMIDDAPDQPFTLADLAAADGLSRFQTIRAFKAATGLPPHAYLVQRRLTLARDLIRRRAGLAHAAAAAGFADQAHMTRVFKAAFGYTPGAYAHALL